MVTSCAELDYPRSDLPATVRYVGHCAWYPREPVPDWVEELPADRQWVHVFEGTVHTTEPFLMRTARDALANNGCGVVMASGPYRDPAALGLDPLPPNCRVVQWVNHDALMARMSVLVCAGNTGAILAALRRGVPIVSVATDWDHAENAQRVVQAGAGIRLSRRRCTPGRLRDAVMRVLRDPSYARQARRIGAALDRHGGADEAAALIERACVR
jgi:MGT family glycosyltransferase